jgi:hypothetical protein
VNLLTKTEQFDDAAWTKSNGTITANATTAPDGALTADLFTATSTTGFVRQTATAQVGLTYSQLFALKRFDNDWVLVNITGVANTGVWFNLVTGEFGASQAGVISKSSVALSDGWYQVQITWLAGVVTVYPTVRVVTSDANSAGALASVYIWGADLRPTNQGVNLPAYQRVNTSTDYDSVGFPVYIKPNGSNQFMQTNSINFTATDKMTVWQGVRKLSSSTFQIITETGTDSFSVAGSFGIFPTGPVQRTESYGTFLRGSNIGYAGFGPYVAPITNVLQLSYDIGASSITDEIAARINGAAVGYEITGGSAGTGNFGNLPAYFYMRAGTSFPFNGHDYGSIARGAASTAAQIANGETYINKLTKAF